MCVEKFNNTTTMGNVMTVFVDIRGELHDVHLFQISYWSYAFICHHIPGASTQGGVEAVASNLS